MNRIALAVATLVLFSASQADAQSRSAAIAQGRKIAQDNCAACHAIGKTDKSKRRAAPAFRTLSKRYDLDELQEAFVEGVSVGHKGVDMPEFQFTPDRTDALITYLKSLQK